MEFTGKVAAVTGAGDGIGQRAAELLAERGAQVACVDFNLERAQAVADGITQKGGVAIAVGGDVSDLAQVRDGVEAILARFGQIDILINNAGIAVMHPVAEITAEDWRRVLAVNLDGSFYWAQTVAVRSMIPRREGAIVNVASTAGLVAVPNVMAYTVSKHGVVGLTRSLAAELGNCNIRTNAICPGITETAMARRSAEANPEAAADRVVRIPLGRVATVDDQAEMILFLASPRAASVNGAIVPVDGGIVALSAGWQLPK